MLKIPLEFHDFSDFSGHSIRFGFAGPKAYYITMDASLIEKNETKL